MGALDDVRRARTSARPRANEPAPHKDPEKVGPVVGEVEVEAEVEVEKEKGKARRLPSDLRVTRRRRRRRCWRERGGPGGGELDEDSYRKRSGKNLARLPSSLQPPPRRRQAVTRRKSGASQPGLDAFVFPGRGAARGVIDPATRSSVAGCSDEGARRRHAGRGGGLGCSYRVR